MAVDRHPGIGDVFAREHGPPLQEKGTLLLLPCLRVHHVLMEDLIPGRHISFHRLLEAVFFIDQLELQKGRLADELMALSGSLMPGS